MSSAATGAAEALSTIELAGLPTVITPEVAARVLGVTPKSIRVACSEGAFACFKTPGGKYWRILTSSFLKTYGLDREVETVRALMPEALAGPWVGRVYVGDGSSPAKVVDDRQPEGEEQSRMAKRATFEEIRDMPRTLTVADVARIGGKSQKTIRRYLTGGELRGAKVGAQWVVDKGVACSFFGISSPALLGS